MCLHKSVPVRNLITIYIYIVDNGFDILHKQYILH